MKITTKEGEDLGQSQRTAKIAIAQVVASRATMAAPSMGKYRYAAVFDQKIIKMRIRP
jgi:hypothetical protein